MEHLSGADKYLVPSMEAVPIVLLVAGAVLRGLPWLREWIIPLVIWCIGVAVGVLYDTAPGLLKNLTNGVEQGSIATAVALVYWRGLKGLLRD